MGWGNEICSNSRGHMTKLASMFVYEPSHEKTCLTPYANNKDTDQPAHPCSLINVFVVRLLDSRML